VTVGLDGITFLLGCSNH